MKKIIFFLFINLIFANQVTAQTADNKNSRQLKHEVGINATAFIKEILSLGDTSSAFNNSPYLITYKLITKQSVGFRAGFGGQYNRQKETEDTPINTNNVLDWRVGIEWQETIGQRLTTSVGADFINSFSFSKNIIDAGYDLVTFEEKSFMIGGGPVLGLAFNFNDKVSLYAEAAAYFSRGKISTSINYKDFPERNFKVDDITRISLLLYAPASIYFVFKF